MRSILLLLGVGGFLFWQLSRTASGFLVEVLGVDIFFNRATAMIIPGRIRMRVVNPTPTAVEVQGYAGRVLLNGREIAIFTGPGFRMPANGQQDLDVSINIQTQALLSAAPGLIRNTAAGNSPAVVIVGTVTAAGIPVEFTKEVVLTSR